MCAGYPGAGFPGGQNELRRALKKPCPRRTVCYQLSGNKNELKGLGNNLRIVVAVKEGTIFTAENLEVSRRGERRDILYSRCRSNGMKSLFTPNTRWRVVTEAGL